MANILDDYTEKINGTFTFFDRIIIQGNIQQLVMPGQDVQSLYRMGVLLKDYKVKVEEITKQIVDGIENYAKKHHREVIYLNKHSGPLQDTMNEYWKRHPEIEKGLIVCYKTLEVCSTRKVIGGVAEDGRGLLRLVNSSTKCAHYYLYFNDKKLGLMFVKIQTWFPFTIQFHVNGREMMKAKFDSAGIEYSMYDNSFSTLSDVERAQSIADQFEHNKLIPQLDHFASIVNPWLKDVKEKLSAGYYWTVQQCEVATDIMFKTRQDLEDIYPSIVHHMLTGFNAKDVFTFLGRKLTPQYKGQAGSDFKNRPIGCRVKFRMKSNSIKCYDKGNCLRIETTINDLSEFKIFRWVHPKDKEKEPYMAWRIMGKSIKNMERVIEVATSSNRRFIAAMNNIVPCSSVIGEVEKICESIRKTGKTTAAGLNVWNHENSVLFDTILSGDHLIKGFTNKAIRDIIYPNIKDKKKRASKMTRTIGKLHMHGLIRKIPRTQTYMVTDLGRRVMSALQYSKKELFPMQMANV